MNKVLHIVLALVVFSSVYMPAVPADAGLLEFLFPALRKDDTAPTADGRAPFAAGQAPAAITVDPQGTTPLNQAHRSSNDISAWLVTAVSESMTFEHDSYRDDLAQSAVYFDESGLRLYQEFLAKDKLLDVLQSGKYHVRTIVQDQPLLLNEGVVDGRYRWLFEVPVMVSFMDRAMSDYKNAVPQSQTMMLSIQAGRSPAAQNDTGVLIERWSGRVTGQVKTKK